MTGWRLGYLAGAAEVVAAASALQAEHQQRLHLAQSAPGPPWQGTTHPVSPEMADQYSEAERRLLG